jgi:lipid II:glycine glycyltransferase (peptidoglycan interpeptide bridge formation enzyme)
MYDEGMKAFEETYGRMCEAKGATHHPTSFSYSLRDFCRKWPRRGFILSSWLEGALMGAIVVFTLGERAIYAYGTSHLERRKVPKHHLLHLTAMRRARELGCRLYDWGGFTPGGAPEQRSGARGKINFFKSRFGGQPVRFLPAYERIQSPLSYHSLRLLNRIWKRAHG